MACTSREGTLEVIRRIYVVIQPHLDDEWQVSYDGVRLIGDRWAELTLTAEALAEQERIPLRVVEFVRGEVLQEYHGER